MTRFGPRAILLPGLALIAAGLAWFTRAPIDGSYLVDVLPAMLPLGIGAGLTFPALMTMAMSGATPADSGLASGLVNTTQQVGGALGLAVLASLSTTRTDSLRDAGDPVVQALTGGYRLAFGIAAGLVVVGIAIALLVLEPPKAAQAEEVVEGELAFSEAG